MFAVNLEKDFIGKDAVIKNTEDGNAEKLIGLEHEGRQSPRAGQKIKNDVDEIIGEVTSGSFGPTLGYSIAFAYVNRDFCELGTEVQIDTGRKLLSARVCKTPFYINKEARK